MLAAGIAAYDLFLIASGVPTLSESFATAVRNPVRRWPTVCSWAIVSAHLFSAIPRRYDPFHRLAGMVEKTRKQ